MVTFLACLSISAFLWLMNTLSKKYTDTIPFQVQYLHQTNERKFVPNSSVVNLKVITSGYNLLAYKLGIRENIIYVDANSFRHKDNQYLYNLQTEIHQDKIREQLGDQTILLEIATDTLFLRPANSN